MSTLHLAIDDASRVALIGDPAKSRQEDAIAFLERALAWYARMGANVERVTTGNGSAYRSKFFAAALRKASVRHVRTRPHTPRTDGKAERFLQTSLREWTYARPYKLIQPALRLHQALDQQLQSQTISRRYRPSQPIAAAEQPSWKRHSSHPSRMPGTLTINTYLSMFSGASLASDKRPSPW